MKEEVYNQRMMEANLEGKRIENQTSTVQLGMAGMNMQNDVGMVKEQLSLGEELEVIDYVIRSYT